MFLFWVIVKATHDTINLCKKSVKIMEFIIKGLDN